MLLGHTKQINGVWKIQSLKQHSENVAEYCARACQPLGLENLGRLTGWLHDVGKSHINVQKHLRGQTNEKSIIPAPECGGYGKIMAEKQLHHLLA